MEIIVKRSYETDLLSYMKSGHELRDTIYVKSKIILRVMRALWLVNDIPS